MRGRAGDVQLAGGIAGEVGKDTAEVFFEQIDLYIGDIAGNIDRRTGDAVGGMEEGPRVNVIVQVIRMDGSVDEAGGFLVIGGEVELADRVVGETELVGRSVEVDAWFSKWVCYIDAAGKQSFDPLRLFDEGGEIAQVDFLQVDVNIVPFTFRRGVVFMSSCCSPL
jgi:hypothetical protein